MENKIEKIIIITVVVIINFVFLEIGLRAIDRSPSNQVEGYFEQDGDSYRLQKNIIKYINWSAFNYTVCTNSLHMRDNKVGDVELINKNYVLFLGDSQTFGHGVDYDSSFVGVLSERIDTNISSIKVFNLAVGGHKFSRQVKLFFKLIAKTNTKPEIVCIGITPQMIYSTLWHRDIIVKNGYLYNQDNWLRPYIKTLISNSSAVYCFIRDNVRNSNLFKAQSKEEFINFFKYYRKNSKYISEKNINDWQIENDEFVSYLHNNDILPVYVYFPVIDLLNGNSTLESIGENIQDYDLKAYEKIVTNYCQNKKIFFLNLRPILDEKLQSGHELRFKLDPHYNNYTNKVVGHYLYKCLQNLI